MSLVNFNVPFSESKDQRLKKQSHKLNKSQQQ